MTEIELRAPAHLVSRRARGYWTVRAVPGWLIIGGIETAILTSDGITDTARVAVLAPTIVLALAHLLVMPQWRFPVPPWGITHTPPHTPARRVNPERPVPPPPPPPTRH